MPLQPNAVHGQQPQPFVGEIYVVGSNRHEARVRAIADLWPGQKLSYPDLKIAEEKLVASGLFKVDPEAGIRPTVQALDDSGPFKGIVIKVEDLPPDPVECVASTVFLSALAIAAMLLASIVYRRRLRRVRPE